MKKRIALVVIFIALLYATACGKKEITTPDTLESSSYKDSITTSNGLLTVVYFDTGKSDAMLIHLDDFSMFIDTGDADDAEHYAEVMKELGITRLDYILLTHLDADHIGGAAYLLDHYETGAVIQPDYTDTSETYNAYMAAMDRHSLKPVLPTKTMEVRVGDSVLTLFPAEKKYYDNVNNFSIVTSLVDGNQRFLFCGDANPERIKELLTLNLGHYNVYKVPHHGFYNKEQKALIDAVTPEYAVITNKSLDNISSDVIQDLEQEGARICYTCKGDVVVQTDGTKIEVGYRAVK